MPEIIDPERIAKLPVWAQNYIEGLKEVIDRKDERIARLVEAPADLSEARIVQVDYADLSTATPLPEHQPIRFYMENDIVRGEYLEARVEREFSGQRWLTVRASARSSRHRMIFQPVVSNEIHIGLVEW